MSKSPFKFVKKVASDLKKVNWTEQMVSLVIVILGIFIAYRLTLVSEKSTELGKIRTLKTNLILENEKNLEEFEELRTYRKNTEHYTYRLVHVLNDSLVNEDSIRYYIFKLARISTPDIQLQALESFIKSTYELINPNLKNEAIHLKALYDEWLDNTKSFEKEKTDHFFFYLFNHINFYNGEIINLEGVLDLKFRNTVLTLYNDEKEQNRLYNQTFEQVNVLQKSLKE